MSSDAYVALYDQIVELFGEDDDRDPAASAAIWVALGELCEADFNDHQRQSFEVARRFWDRRASEGERLARLEVESGALDRLLANDDVRERALQRIAFASLVAQPGWTSDHIECAVDCARALAIPADRVRDACRSIPAATHGT